MVPAPGQAAARRCEIAGAIRRAMLATPAENTAFYSLSLCLSFALRGKISCCGAPRSTQRRVIFR